MRSIVFIVVDTLRADHLGCYGYHRSTSPFLDTLAEQSSVLDACYSTSNFTAPAFTSLFTSTYPYYHGNFFFNKQIANSPIKECLDAHRFDTHAIVTFGFFKNLLSRIWGGLEVVTETRSFDFSKELTGAVSDGAIEWLERWDGDRPFCLFLHYRGGHAPYRLPAEYETLFDSTDPDDIDQEIVEVFFPQHIERPKPKKKGERTFPRKHQLVNAMNTGRRKVNKATRQWIIDKYDASIKCTDDNVARVFESLKSHDRYRDTIFAVFSDHGEELWDHGQFGHADVHLYEEVIRTVGIIHDPLRTEAVRKAEPISHIQVMPSLMRLAGVRALPKQLVSFDFTTDMERKSSIDQPNLVFCIGPHKAAVRQGNLKLIEASPCHYLSKVKRLRSVLRILWMGELRRELYDLGIDPREKDNLANQSTQLRPLSSLLKQHIRVTKRRSDILDSGFKLSAAEQEKLEEELRSLGYL
ncbi:MAG: sulfatase-like hydrolase/transferase [bacterium]|nr:MAG: sulfatase-like hydrolase/transferase [bacterium]